MAGTITISKPIVLSRDASGRAVAQEVSVSWVADAADGSIPSLAVTDFHGWWITKVVTNPGSTAPTALYDITGLDVDGADIFDSELLNRSATVTERLIPLNFIQIGQGGFTLGFANNLVNSAIGAIRLFLNR